MNDSTSEVHAVQYHCCLGIFFVAFVHRNRLPRLSQLSSVSAFDGVIALPLDKSLQRPRALTLDTVH